MEWACAGVKPIARVEAGQHVTRIARVEAGQRPAWKLGSAARKDTPDKVNTRAAKQWIPQRTTNLLVLYVYIYIYIYNVLYVLKTIYI